LILGAVILLAAVCASALWLPGLVRDPVLRRRLLMGVPVAVTLVVVTPLIDRITRGRYIGSLTAFLMSVFAGFVAAQVVLALIASLHGGKDEAFFLKGRRDSMNQFLNQQP
jgi:hypothetical protein